MFPIRSGGRLALNEGAKAVPDSAPIDQAVMIASMGAEKQGPATIVQSAEKTGAQERGRTATLEIER